MRSQPNRSLAVAILVAVATAGCAKKEQKEAEAPAPVQVTAVTQDTIRRIVAGDGALFPLDQQNVMPKPAPSGASSPVQKFYVNRGDHVKTGQLLAVLENRDLKYTAESNRSQVEQAEANLKATEGAQIPESVVKARTDVEAGKEAAAQVAAARGQFQSAEAAVAYTEIHSPMNGTIADRPLYAGDIASTGQPLFTIVDVSRVVARVNVPQAQASMVKVGMPADVQITDGGEQVQGKVTVVSPSTDPASTTVQVWIQIDNPGERLKPGASVHANIVAEAFKAVPVIPVSAILPGEEGGQMVLVVDSNSVAHQRPVQLGVREGGKVQVLNGARPGEEVVIVGGLGVDDKDKVKVIDTTVKESEDEDEDNAPPEPPAKGDQKKEAKPKGQ